MFEALERFLLRLLRLPPEPEAPSANLASVRLFRASRKLYLLRLVRWALTQAGALLGIIFWVAVIGVSEHEANRMRSQPDGSRGLPQLPAGRNQFVAPPLQKIPPTLFGWLWAAKGLGVAVYVAQLLLTYLSVRLDYRFRWYIVTDRSLRIRSGLWNVQEVTMSYANLQQVVMSQGPIERLLGISNVLVQSAGGGAKQGEHGESKAEKMHIGVFHGVDNAAEIRDLILARLRLFREAGLGDPDDLPQADARVGSAELCGALVELVGASRELRDEARKARQMALSHRM